MLLQKAVAPILTSEITIPSNLLSGASQDLLELLSAATNFASNIIPTLVSLCTLSAVISCLFQRQSIWDLPEGADQQCSDQCSATPSTTAQLSI